MIYTAESKGSSHVGIPDSEKQRKINREDKIHHQIEREVQNFTSKEKQLKNQLQVQKLNYEKQEKVLKDMQNSYLITLKQKNQLDSRNMIQKKKKDQYIDKLKQILQRTKTQSQKIKDQRTKTNNILVMVLRDGLNHQCGDDQNILEKAQLIKVQLEKQRNNYFYPKSEPLSLKLASDPPDSIQNKSYMSRIDELEKNIKPLYEEIEKLKYESEQKDISLNEQLFKKTNQIDKIKRHYSQEANKLKSQHSYQINTIRSQHLQQMEKAKRQITDDKDEEIAKLHEQIGQIKSQRFQRQYKDLQIRKLKGQFKKRPIYHNYSRAIAPATVMPQGQDHQPNENQYQTEERL